jgi:hypothetical protein
MTRFSKVFLRDSLRGRIYLAGFGKHPAWDDHLDDIGLETESLAITKLVIYSEGIASQISSGTWNQLEASGHALDFDHRFVWSRGDQSIVGGIWASADGKGRTLFPVIICVQCEARPQDAVGRYLPPIERLSLTWKREKTRQGVFAARDLTFSEILSSFPSPPGAVFENVGEPDENTILPGLMSLLGGLKSVTGNEAEAVGVRLRLPGITRSPAENLSFWAGYADREANVQTACLTLAPAHRRFVDLLVGQPPARDFFCLRADEIALPLTEAGSMPGLPKRLELEAREYLRTFRLGSLKGASPKRSWWSGLFQKFAD